MFVTAQLPHNRTSAAVGRRFVREVLSGWSPDKVGVAIFLTSELVTNVVIYADSDVELVVHDSDGDLLVSVTEQCSRLALVIQSVDGLIDQGRTLSLVQAMSDDWGIAVNGHRNTVWVSLQKPGRI